MLSISLEYEVYRTCIRIHFHNTSQVSNHQFERLLKPFRVQNKSIYRRIFSNVTRFEIVSMLGIFGMGGSGCKSIFLPARKIPAATAYFKEIFLFATSSITGCRYCGRFYPTIETRSIKNEKQLFYLLFQCFSKYIIIYKKKTRRDPLLTPSPRKSASDTSITLRTVLDLIFLTAFEYSLWQYAMVLPSSYTDNSTKRYRTLMLSISH